MAIVESAEAGVRAVARGATMIQLRAPQRTAREVEMQAMRLANGAVGVRVLVSSRCDLALAAGLAGVNLPENDISVGDARKLLGRRTVSRSVHSEAASEIAERDGADFLLFGPVWPTSSHPGREPQGIEALKRIIDSSRIPVIAIGGVTAERIPELYAAGAAGYAAIGMFR